MKKIIFLFALFLFLFPKSLFAQNYDGCDNVYGYKNIDSKNYGFVCQKNGDYYVVVNNKISSEKYKYIVDFYISFDYKNIIILGSKDTENEFFLYLNNNILYKSDKISEIIFSTKTQDFYYTLWQDKSNLMKNGEKVPIDGITEFYNLNFDKEGNFYYMGCNGSCSIYKNNKIFKTNADNFNFIGDEIGYIEHKDNENNVIINGENKYTTKNNLSNLLVNKEGNFYVIEKKDGNNFINYNGKIISDNIGEFGQFIVSSDFKNYSYFNLKNNLMNLYYNDKFLYSSGSLIMSSIFYKNNFYYQKEDFCYYDIQGKTDKDFCANGGYYMITSNDGNILYQGFYNDLTKFKINGKIINTKGKLNVNFLGFSNDSKKIVLAISKGGLYKVYSMKIQ